MVTDKIRRNSDKMKVINLTINISGMENYFHFLRITQRAVMAE